MVDFLFILSPPPSSSPVEGEEYWDLCMNATHIFTPCAQQKMWDTISLQKGGITWDISRAKKSPSPFAKRENFMESFHNHPPFLKGDRGGFCCALVFPKITAACSLYKQSLTIPPAQQVGFVRSKSQGVGFQVSGRKTKRLKPEH